MTTPNPSPPTGGRKRRLPTARQAGWALTLATAAALAAGLLLVNRLGGGAGAPVVEFDTTEPPARGGGDSSPFQVLEHDEPVDGAVGPFAPTSSTGVVWPETLFPQPPAAETANQPGSPIQRR